MITLRGGVLRETIPLSMATLRFLKRHVQYLTTALGIILFGSVVMVSGYGVGFWCTRSLVRILSGSYISTMHLFICFLVTDFVRKNCECRLHWLTLSILFENSRSPLSTEYGSCLSTKTLVSSVI